ncbi:unnamed protein product [Nesidiocoris tenuis]|uniref:Aminopeptidase N-like N-terminal domain-containing protein n=1 Tax=Nesidiocoris tenuis TaxID=355587 RepID=A0A6H5GQ76_9HEMI|nr:unnamed protein product [Nesidiocoris tenuis]
MDEAINVDFPGNKIYLTNFYPIYARKFFPCIDEPGSSATIALTVTVTSANGKFIASSSVTESKARYAPSGVRRLDLGYLRPEKAWIHSSDKSQTGDRRVCSSRIWCSVVGDDVIIPGVPRPGDRPCSVGRGSPGLRKDVDMDISYRPSSQRSQTGRSVDSIQRRLPNDVKPLSYRLQLNITNNGLEPPTNYTVTSGVGSPNALLEGGRARPGQLRLKAPRERRFHSIFSRSGGVAKPENLWDALNDPSLVEKFKPWTEIAGHSIVVVERTGSNNSTLRLSHSKVRRLIEAGVKINLKDVTAPLSETDEDISKMYVINRSCKYRTGNCTELMASIGGNWTRLEETITIGTVASEKTFTHKLGSHVRFCLRNLRTAYIQQPAEKSCNQSGRCGNQRHSEKRPRRHFVEGTGRRKDTKRPQHGGCTLCTFCTRIRFGHSPRRCTYNVHDSRPDDLHYFSISRPKTVAVMAKFCFYVFRYVLLCT